MTRERSLGRISKTKMQEVSACFDEFSENKGYLDRDDLKVAVTALLGFRPSKFEVEQMLASEVSNQECPGLTKQQFSELMARRLAVVDSTEEVRQMFRAFDKKCRGFITREDMLQVLSGVFSEDEMPPAKMAEMFAEADWDRNGRVGFQEFEAMVTKQLPAELLRRRGHSASFSGSL